MPKKSSDSVKVFFPKVNREQVIKEIDRCIREFSKSLGLYKVVLFGSYARGNFTVASDIDIFIVFDEEKSSEEDVRKTLMKNIKLPRVELHILSRKNYETAVGLRWIKTIEEEGVKILDNSNQD